MKNISDLEDSGIQDQRNSSLSFEIAHPHGNKPQWIFESQGASKVSTRIQDTPKNVSWYPHPVMDWTINICTYICNCYNYANLDLE